MKKKVFPVTLATLIVPASYCEPTLKKLHEKPRSHPYMLGGEMDRQLQEYVKSLRESKTVVNSSIVASAAEGMVKSCDRKAMVDILSAPSSGLRIS